jgi:hypothetical protein
MMTKHAYGPEPFESYGSLIFPVNNGWGFKTGSNLYDADTFPEHRPLGLSEAVEAAALYKRDSKAYYAYLEEL